MIMNEESRVENQGAPGC